MIKKFLFLVSLCSIAMYSPVLIAEDDFYDEYDYETDDLSFDEFATVDSEDIDVNAERVSFDYDKGPVDVQHFDIAGVMLGMDYDEVYNLFFNHQCISSINFSVSINICSYFLCLCR